MAEILAAAREVYIEKGFNDLVISDIAKRAGVVDGSVYRYFGTKRDLLFQVAADWLRENVSRNEEDLAQIDGGWDQIRFYVSRHLATLHSQPELSSLVFIHLRPDPDYKSTELFQLTRAYSEQMVNVIQRGITKGELRGDVSPNLVRDIIFGSLEHRSWSYLRGEGGFSPAKIADELMDCLRLGLAVRTKSEELDETIARLESVVATLRS